MKAPRVTNISHKLHSEFSNGVLNYKHLNRLHYLILLNAFNIRSYSKSDNAKLLKHTASFTIVPINSKDSNENKNKLVEDAFKKSMKVPKTSINQKLYKGSGLLMPKLPKDLEDELTFEEFMTKMMKERDYESMYKRMYGKDPTEDEEYQRFKTVMLADPLNDKLIDFRKDENIDIVEMTRDQYLKYRENRVELKYAYAKYGYEKIKIYHNPNRKGLYELHLFKPEKKLDKDQQFQLNKIKYHLRNSLGLSPQSVSELKKLKIEHEEKKKKKLEEEIIKNANAINLKKNKSKIELEENSKTLFQKVKDLTKKISSEEINLSKNQEIQSNLTFNHKSDINSNTQTDNELINSISIQNEIGINTSMENDLLQDETIYENTELNIDEIREFMKDDSKVARIAKELDIPASLLKTIYLEGGLEEIEEVENNEDTESPFNNLTEKQVSTLAKSLAGKTKFDLDLTKKSLENSIKNSNASIEVTQSENNSKPVLKYTYEEEFDKIYDMNSEERILELREQFGLMTIGMVTLPYNIYRKVKNILRNIPRDDLFKAARIVATVLRVRMSGFGKNFEHSSLNTKIDPNDIENEQKRILKDLKTHINNLQLNEDGKYSQLDAALSNLQDKQNIKLQYDLNESAAYIALRLPGTFAVNTQVFTEISKRLPDWKPKSLLDFGAGTGSSILAANGIWGNYINDILAIEPSSANMNHAIELVSDVKSPITWRRYLTDHFRRKYDLVTISYVLNEIPEKEKRLQILETLWNITDGVLVVIDHGTPLGFNLIREAREFILSRTDVEEMEPTVLSPCPHDSICPMAGSKWCHFRQRIERPDFLRQIKNRALLKKDSHLTRSYEDEDFSYIVIRRKGITGLDPIEEVKERENLRLSQLRQQNKLNKDKERIRMEMLLYKRKLSRESHSWPRLVEGSKLLVRKVSMNLCTPQGTLSLGELYPKTIGRKNGYRLARVARRGDLFSFPRRLIDPNKPSSRELYLSKHIKQIKNAREEKIKMKNLIEEFGLIPGKDVRIQNAQKRWKKIKEHWENPKEDRSFSAIKSKPSESDLKSHNNKHNEDKITHTKPISIDKISDNQDSNKISQDQKLKSKIKLKSNGKKIRFLYRNEKKIDRL